MVFPSSAGIAFVHLHVHSVFSYRDGAAPIGRLVEKARELNMEALALTDHNTLSGAVRFYVECRKLGVRPILGAEIDLLPQELPSLHRWQTANSRRQTAYRL